MKAYAVTSQKGVEWIHLYLVSAERDRAEKLAKALSQELPVHEAHIFEQPLEFPSGVMVCACPNIDKGGTFLPLGKVLGALSETLGSNMLTLVERRHIGYEGRDFVTLKTPA